RRSTILPPDESVEAISLSRKISVRVAGVAYGQARVFGINGLWDRYGSSPLLSIVLDQATPRYKPEVAVPTAKEDHWPVVYRYWRSRVICVRPVPRVKVLEPRNTAAGTHPHPPLFILVHLLRGWTGCRI